jgi:hypothetical protein
VAVHGTGSLAPAALAPAGGLLLGVRLAGLRLDARLAAGDDPWADAALTRRAQQLLTRRARRRIGAGLERVCSARPRRATFSSAILVDARAVEIARPALEQLAAALRSREAVPAQAVALANVLLTNGSSALYRPAYPDELQAVARGAQVALAPDQAPDRMLEEW